MDRPQSTATAEHGKIPSDGPFAGVVPRKNSKHARMFRGYGGERIDFIHPWYEAL